MDAATKAKLTTTYWPKFGNSAKMLGVDVKTGVYYQENMALMNEELR